MQSLSTCSAIMGSEHLIQIDLNDAVKITVCLGRQQVCIGVFVMPPVKSSER